jgi:hypothetical protein
MSCFHSLIGVTHVTIGEILPVSDALYIPHYLELRGLPCGQRFGRAVHAFVTGSTALSKTTNET